MGRNTRSAPLSCALETCTEKSVALLSLNVVSLTISRFRAAASSTNVSRMPLEYTSSFFQMMAIFSPSPCSLIYSADLAPCPGSVKHIWKTLSLPSMVATEEAEGVRAKMRSAKFSADVASPGLEVTEPRESCIPQSFKTL